MSGVNDKELEVDELPKFAVEVSHEAKLKELLRNLSSLEIKLYSDAAREFIKLLRSEVGGAFLREYIRTSSKCFELLQVWKLRQGKPGLSYLLSLISAILSHPDGLYKESDRERIYISRALDKFARLIIEEKLEDVCKELNSKEAKSQNAALLLLASIVRRGSGLASDVAKSFDFKLPVFKKLAEYKRKKDETKRKPFTRDAFVGFAMSFLEVGKPGLLRWIIQQKEMYSGVLCGLGNDDDETVAYVLSTLHDKILIPESVIPPSLRSVLFGSVTLDQLISISGREDGGEAAELAHDVLIMVCTNPANGLMPDLNRHPNPLRGNIKRLSDVMKKLKATEVDHHRDLLLAIVKGRPSFGSLYMDEFPYNLEDHASPSWFRAISLAACLISSVGSGFPFGFLESHPDQPPSLNNPDVQSIIRCVGPRPFTRSVVNKGLLHANSLVKHGTLRLVLESLRLLESFISTIERNICSTNQLMHGWASLKQDIQNEVRILLPDPQVLFSLLSSFSSRYKSPNSCLKRPAEGRLEGSVNAVKKLKTGSENKDVDILVSGLCSSDDTALLVEDVDEFNNGDAPMKVIADIWGLEPCSIHYGTEEDEQTHLFTNLLDALKIYHRATPASLEGSIDFFKVLPTNPLALPIILQHSLLSLLIQLVGWSAISDAPTRTPALMYKHLHVFLNMLLYSPKNDIKDQAQVLARAAMLSTGAFDKNVREIDAWFLFLPGFGNRNTSSIGEQGYEVFQNFFSVVVSFLSDAVSTTGNNLSKYWDLLRSRTYQLKGVEDVSPKFSPLIICALEKCLRLLASDSGTFTLPEKSMISLYVCNTIKYLLQTQEEVGLLSSLVDALISKKVHELCSSVDTEQDLCEWRPLKSLLLFTQSIGSQESCTLYLERKAVHADSSFATMLGEVKKVLSGIDNELVGVTKAFILSTLSTAPAAIAEHFPSVVSVSQLLFGVPYSLLFSIVFLEPKILDTVLNLWPEMFLTGLENAVAMIVNENNNEESTDTIEAGWNLKGSVSVAFCSFLKQAPFHVLFPAFISTNGACLPAGSKQLDFLQAKLSQESSDNSHSNLRLLLFWFHQIQLCYRMKPMAKLEQFSEACFILIEKLLAPFLVKPNSKFQSIQDHSLTQHILAVAEIILFHPVLMMSLESPLDIVENIAAEFPVDSLENFLESVKQGVHNMNHHVFNLLRCIFERLQSFCNCGLSVIEVNHCTKSVVEAIQALAKKLDTVFRERFEFCIKTENWTHLFPTLRTLQILFRFIAPLDLLELARWIFSTINLSNCKLQVDSQNFALSIGLWIAGCAFDMLMAYFQLPCTEGISYSTFWGQKGMIVDGLLFEDVYSQVLEIAMVLELQFADLCFLKAVNVANICKVTRNQCLPLCIEIRKVISNTSLKVLPHCMQKSGVTRTKTLFLLTEVSPFHLLVFGQLFSSMMSSYLLPTGDLIKEKCKYALSDDIFVMLLPTVFSYLSSSSIMFRQRSHQCIRDIYSFYYSILFRNFLEWKSFVSRDIFLVEWTESSPPSAEGLLSFASGSLLGQAVLMLRNYLSLDGGAFKLKKRLKLFGSLCKHSGSFDHMLDCDVNKIATYSITQSLNLVNRVVGKVNICKMLLFSRDTILQSPAKEEESSKEICSEVEHDKENSSRYQFLNMLIHTWELIVKKFPLNSGDSGKDLLGFLETFILRNICESTKEMHNHLMKLTSLPCIEKLAKLSLLHRFDDPATLEILHDILALLPCGDLHILVLQLLVAHSQFAPTIHSVAKSSGFPQLGMSFRPMSSILRSLVFPSTDQTVCSGEKSPEKRSELYVEKLSVVKLLKALLQHKDLMGGPGFGEDIGLDLKELLFLLLSSYGATLSEADLEIYKLMVTIESVSESYSESLAEMDYLWGGAAVAIRKQRKEDDGISPDSTHNPDLVDEMRRSQFRENLPIDPKMCAMTVLYFPYNRTVGKRTSSLNKGQEGTSDDIFECSLQTDFATGGRVQTYDPVFILRLAIHSLSMGFIEPLEFASLGLLSVAFISLSSPDDEMRKLGYEALGRFKTVLENCQKRKDIMRLRLLLTYLQNGIEEPWQRIPSIIAMFVAEASFILLDPSHDHYSTISKLLMRSSRVNMKGVPLFQNFFHSSSVDFKKDRMWILRLLYAGLNSDDDAQIYIRNNILQTILAFYASSLSDNESKELVLQVVKKSVKHKKMVRHSIKHCGMIPWLSTIVSVLYMDRGQVLQKFSSVLLITVLEVVVGVLASEDIIEWLQKFSLEQLSELSTHLHKLLVEGDLIKEVRFATPILQIMMSTLKISQKRKVYQPHFTLSDEGLFQIYGFIDSENNGVNSHTADLGLNVLLMSTPLIKLLCMDQVKLLKLLRWATSAALQSNFRKQIQTSTTFVEEEQSEDSLISKLLRWLVASVIMGKLSRGPNGLSPNFISDKSNLGMLLSSLELKKGDCEEYEPGFGSDRMLATVILFLQQHLGMDYRLLPSVVSALCLLLFPEFSGLAEMGCLLGDGITMDSLLSKIRCPAEANPSWRWTYYQPWKDLSSETTDSEKMDELHACQSLLLMISNVIAKKSSLKHVLSYQDVEESGVFSWQRSFLES